MSLKEKLENDLKDAIRSKDDLSKSTLRLALSAVKLAEVDHQSELEDEAVTRILYREVKLRRESIADAKMADRPDLVTTSQAEIAILEAFLPESMSPEEIRALVLAAIAEVGATEPGDMGSVMKAVIPKIAGKADGGQVSQQVRELLQSSN